MAWVWQWFYFPASSKIILLVHVVTVPFSFQTLSNFTFPCQSNLVMWHCTGELWPLCAGQCFCMSSMLFVIRLLSKTYEQMGGKDTAISKKKSSFLWFMFANMQVCKYKTHDKSESRWSKPILWFHTKKVDENIINIHKNCPYNCTLFFLVF